MVLRNGNFSTFADSKSRLEFCSPNKLRMEKTCGQLRMTDPTANK
jgi:hypothetical protein